MIKRLLQAIYTYILRTGYEWCLILQIFFNIIIIIQNHFGCSKDNRLCTVTYETLKTIRNNMYMYTRSYNTSDYHYNNDIMFTSSRSRVKSTNKIVILYIHDRWKKYTYERDEIQWRTRRMYYSPSQVHLPAV